MNQPLLETLKQARDALDHYDCLSNFSGNKAERVLPSIRAAIEQLEKAEPDETYIHGVCIRCGNPQQDPTKEHFVDATASEGERTPEDSRPQQVETLHHFSQPGNMVERTPAPQWQPTDEELTAIYKEANGELEKAEPVCWWNFKYPTLPIQLTRPMDGGSWQPLYAHPSTPGEKK